MEGRRYSNASLLLPFFFLVAALTCCGTVGAYKNYTVGGSVGWYDRSENASLDYQKWATGKNFSLGDYLIFNTDTNHSVVRTYNSSAYQSCDIDADDMERYDSDNPSNNGPSTFPIAVPLLKEGPTYFLSGDYDGAQCKAGQRFSINVTHGDGLPEGLKSEAGSLPPPSGGVNDDDDSIPDTPVPSDFSRPLNQSNDSSPETAKTPSSSAETVSVRYLSLQSLFLGILWLF